MASRIHEYVLELDLDAEPIEGRLRDGDEAFPFAGWLGLASALERLSSAATGRADGPPAAQTITDGKTETETKRTRAI